MTLRVHECLNCVELGVMIIVSRVNPASKWIKPKQQKLKAHQRDALRLSVRRNSCDSTGTGSVGTVGAEGGGRMWSVTD